MKGFGNEEGSIILSHLIFKCPFMLYWPQRIYHYAVFITRRFFEDHCIETAGSLTYTTLLSLVPVITVTLTVLAPFPFFAQLVEQAKLFIERNLVPEVSARMISVYMEQFAGNAAQLTTLGLVLLGVTGLLLISTIDSTFNTIWRTRRKRSWLKRWLVYGILLVLGPVLIGASLMLTLFLIHWVGRFDHVLPLFHDFLLKMVPILLSTLALFLAYRLAPKRHVPSLHAWIGALVAAILFELVKRAFVIYVSLVPTYRLIYGTFASVPIFLLWIYCCWMVVLIGAEISATLSYFRTGKGTTDSTPIEQLGEALALLQALIRADWTAQKLSLRELRRLVPMPIDHAEDILDRLIESGWVRESSGSYSLARPAGEITLDEVYRQFALEGQLHNLTNNPHLNIILRNLETYIEQGMRIPLSKFFSEQMHVNS